METRADEAVVAADPWFIYFPQLCVFFCFPAVQTHYNRTRGPHKSGASFPSFVVACRYRPIGEEGKGKLGTPANVNEL